MKLRGSPLVGDLLEEYREVIRPSRGRAGAMLWVAIQVASLMRPWMWGPVIAAIALLATEIGHLFIKPSPRLRVMAFLQPFGSSYTGDPHPVFLLACAIALSVVAFAAARQRHQWHAGFKAAMVAAVALTFSTAILDYVTSHTATRLYGGVVSGRVEYVSWLMRWYARERLHLRIVETAQTFPIHLVVMLALGAACGAIGATLARVQSQRMERDVERKA